MNDLVPDPTDVKAPDGALAWTASRGFMTTRDDLDEALIEGEVVLAVTSDGDGHPGGVVADVEGDAPLACVVRLDRDVTVLQRLHARLAERVAALAEQLADHITATR